MSVAEISGQTTSEIDRDIYRKVRDVGQARTGGKPDEKGGEVKQLD